VALQESMQRRPGQMRNRRQRIQAIIDVGVGSVGWTPTVVPAAIPLPLGGELPQNRAGPTALADGPNVSYRQI